jgi:hypothetical protein
MAHLSLLTRKVRIEALAESARLNEAAKKVVDASTDVAEDSLVAANHIRDCLKYGDKAEEAALMLAKACSSAASAEDKQASKRAAVDVKSGIAGLEAVRSALYAPYAQARDTSYKLAAAWNLPTKVSSEKKPPTADVVAMSEKDLAQQIGVAAKTLQVDIRDMLEKGAKAQKLLRAAAKKLGLESGELGEDEKQAIITAVLDFRGSTDPIFGRTQGIKRRAEELHARIVKGEKYESIEDDAELAGLELI